MTFINRTDAGRQLAQALRAYRRVDPVVIGMTRGGVPVAAQVARELGAQLDICVVRKLVSTADPPVTIGAVAEGGATYVDTTRTRALSSLELERIVARETSEVVRLGALLRDRPPVPLRGRDVIVVDDGVVTVGTIRAAARALRDQGPRFLELAVPIANTNVLDDLRADFDRVTCLIDDPLLVAIGARYVEFSPVSEAEVAGLIARAADRTATTSMEAST